MAEYVRVANFEADDAAIDAIVARIAGEDGPPEGVPATAITVLADRAGGRVRIVTRYGSEDDLRKGSEALERLTPQIDAGSFKRASVESFEVLLERKT